MGKASIFLTRRKKTGRIKTDGEKRNVGKLAGNFFELRTRPEVGNYKVPRKLFYAREFTYIICCNLVFFTCQRQILVADFFGISETF
jgi:hypothetical protein